MFCASLRNRPEWAAAVPVLLRKEMRGWKEAKLESHDIAMPMSGVGTNAGSTDSLRFILLSALDLEQSHTMQRIERLFHLEGGRRCAIVFLLSTNGDGLSALGSLQVEIMERLLSIPTLPLASLNDLPATLEAFHDKVVTPRPPQEPPSSSEAKALLQHCSLDGPLSEPQANILSDINTSLSDLVDKISTAQGQVILQDYIREDAAPVIRFWTTELSEGLDWTGQVCWK